MSAVEQEPIVIPEAVHPKDVYIDPDLFEIQAGRISSQLDALNGHHMTGSEGVALANVLDTATQAVGNIIRDPKNLAAAIKAEKDGIVEVISDIIDVCHNIEPINQSRGPSEIALRAFGVERPDAEFDLAEVDTYDEALRHPSTLVDSFLDQRTKIGDLHAIAERDKGHGIRATESALHALCELVHVKGGKLSGTQGRLVNELFGSAAVIAHHDDTDLHPIQ